MLAHVDAVDPAARWRRQCLAAQLVDRSAADGEVRRYLHDDLSLSCDSDEYGSTRNVAQVMIALWPVDPQGAAAMTAAAKPPPAATGVSFSSSF